MLDSYRFQVEERFARGADPRRRGASAHRGADARRTPSACWSSGLALATQWLMGEGERL